MVSKPLYKSV